MFMGVFDKRYVLYDEWFYIGGGWRVILNKLSPL